MMAWLFEKELASLIVFRLFTEVCFLATTYLHLISSRASNLILTRRSPKYRIQLGSLQLRKSGKFIWLGEGIMGMET